MVSLWKLLVVLRIFYRVLNWMVWVIHYQGAQMRVWYTEHLVKADSYATYAGYDFWICVLVWLLPLGDWSYFDDYGCYSVR